MRYLIFSLCLVGCDGRAISPPQFGAGPGSGSGSGSGMTRFGDVIPCSALDQLGCKDAADCKLAPSCPDCSGKTPFVGCLDKSTVATILCTDSCATCTGLSRSDCEASSSCVSVVCDGCGGENFVGCYANTADAPSCPPPPPCAQSCASFTDQSSCNGSGFCHAVATYQRLCNSFDCGSHFELCADGATVDCNFEGSCGFAPVSCGAPYVLSYANGCEAGCVLPTECNQ